MKYLGDFAEGTTIRFMFNTTDTDAAPIDIASGAVAVYKDSDTTPNTADVSLTVGFNGITGLHLVEITPTVDSDGIPIEGNFYTAGSEYTVILSAGTVDSVSVVGMMLGCFSVENRYAVTSLTSGDVETACGTALTNYDPPTKAELDNAVSPLALEASLPNLDSDGNAIVGAIVDVDISALEEKVDAVKAQTDQLLFTESSYVKSYISEIDGTLVNGNGSVTYVYTVYSGGDYVVPEARVYVYNSTTLTKEHLIAYGTSDNFGQITFFLDAGTYYFVRTKVGYFFANPVAVTISE